MYIKIRMVDLKYYIYSKLCDLNYYCCENFNYYYRRYVKTKIDIIYFDYIYPYRYRDNIVAINYI